MSDRTSPIPAPPPAEERGFPMWPVALAVFGMLAFVVGVMLTAFFVSWQRMDWTLMEDPGDPALFHALRDTVQAAGHPVTAEELLAWYPPIEGPNAADELAKAREAVGDAEEALAEMGVYTRNRTEFAYDEPPAAVVEEMRGLLARYGAVVAHLMTATGMERARFPLDFAHGAALDESHFEPMIAFNNLLGMSADVAAADGDLEGAVDAIRRGLRLASFLDEVPLLRSNYMAEVVRREATGTMRRILSRYPLSRDALEELREIYDGLDRIGDFQRAMQGQRAMGIVSLALQFENGSPTPSDRKTRDFFEFYDQAFEAMGDAYPRAHRFEPVGRAFDGYLYCEDLMPLHICQTPVILKRDLAMVRMALLVLAVERFRDDHGRVPMALEELVGDYVDALPADPFDPDGHHIRAGRHSRAYFFYTVYVDGNDGGGAEQANTLSRNPAVEGDDILYVMRGLD